MAAQEMNLSQTVECIKFSVEASKRGIKLPLMLWGEHGIGKTQTVYQFAEQNNYNVVVLHLATQDIADLIGIPREINGNTVWAAPDWLYKAKENSEKTGKPNLFFLDEFSRGHRMVLAAMLPFLIEGKLHTHKIGLNDAVIAAANPPTENYDVQDLNDEALLDRLGHIIYRPTSKEYIDYMVKQGHDKATINILKKNPNWAKIRQFSLPFEVKPSRRSIDYVMRYIQGKGHKWIKKHAPYVIEAYLGTSFMEEWVAEYTKSDDSITLDMIMDYDNYESDITAALTTEIDGVKTHRLDILQKANETIKIWINENKDTITVNDLNWMIKFLNNPMVPGEAAASILMANKVIKAKILEDVDFNRECVGFLREKKIITDDGVMTW
jgi:hypothetical protein